MTKHPMTWTTTVCLAVFLIAVAAFFIVREHLWLRKAHFAQGEVIDLIVSKGSKGRRYRPRIQFVSSDGSLHDFTRNYSTNYVTLSVGGRVTVAYDMTTFEGRIFTFQERFGFPIILAVLGLGLIVAACAFRLGPSLILQVYPVTYFPQ